MSTPRADRVPLRYPVELILEGGLRRTVRTLNINQSGMLVESVLPIKPGSRVRISAKELPFLCVDALIRRCARQWFVYRVSLEFDTHLSRLFEGILSIWAHSEGRFAGFTCPHPTAKPG